MRKLLYFVSITRYYGTDGEYNAHNYCGVAKSSKRVLYTVTTSIQNDVKEANEACDNES